MNSLPCAGFSQRCNSFRSGVERLLHPRARGSTDYVVAIEGCFKRNRRIKIFIEFFTELMQFVERQTV
jgi:hypothetical protein